jgi:uncharacterized alkaline shock family protein YloU
LQVTVHIHSRHLPTADAQVAVAEVAAEAQHRVVSEVQQMDHLMLHQVQMAAAVM